MKVPIDWLKEFIQISWSDDELVERVVRLGIGVKQFEGGVLDLEIAPNRGDLLSILGLSRELHAVTGNPIKEAGRLPIVGSAAPITVTISDGEVVPRYTSAVVTGISVAPTKSETIVKRLEAAGMRPINNVVDITNYVMLEMGQPSHAFNLGKIRGPVMHIRGAKSGERLVTLDGVDRELPDGSLIIEDKERIIDLAGIMGGENSEIDGETRDIVLQAAVFDPVVIRRASKRLKLTTEASYRYERGVDQANCIRVLERLLFLLQEEAGGTVTGVLDVTSLSPSPSIAFSPSLVTRLVGKQYETGEVGEILTRLGCKIEGSGETFTVVPPSWRHDLTIPEDLVEEVIRLIGYETIGGETLPTSKVPKAADYLLTESFKDDLTAAGLSEVMTYSLLGEQDLSLAGTPVKQAVAITNPLSPALKFFRPDLLPGLLRAAAKNPTVDPLRIFEIGHVATREREWVRVGVLFAGKGAADITTLATSYGLTVTMIPETSLRLLKIRKKDVFVALGDWEKVKKLVQPREQLVMPTRFTVKPLSKFPPVTRDISVVVKSDVRNDEVKMAIAGVSEYIHLVELFDEYTNPKLGTDRKSLAFHIQYQHPEKTLTSDEVNKLHQEVEQFLVKQFGATVRQ